MARRSATIRSRRASTAESEAGIMIVMSDSPRAGAPLYRMETSTSRGVWVGRQTNGGHRPARLLIAGGLCDNDGPGTQANGHEQPMKITTSSVLIAFAFAAASPAMGQAVATGKTSFNKCLPCHSVGEGAKNKVGPVLNGLN